MNKGQGATTIGAILLAGVMLQPRTSSPPPPSGGAEKNVRAAGGSVKHASGDGPWLASCKYWASGLSASAEAAKKPKPKTPPSLNLEIKQTEDSFESTIKGTPGNDIDCAADGWGIPQDEKEDPAHLPEISVVIATIPDPIHSHLSLDFDRGIDAILLAAANNRYLASSYWLPWRSRSSSLSSAESASPSADEMEQATKREKQPGLIVLRYAPDRDQLDAEVSDWKKTVDAWKAAEQQRIQYNKDHSGRPQPPIPYPVRKHSLAEAAYHRVIYLFLVAETPALGVNGNQLQAAFAHERFLHEQHRATYSVRPIPTIGGVPDPTGPLSIIGPFFSGSAASLREGIEVARPSLRFNSVSISGVTGTSVAANELDPESTSPPSYISFGENASFEENEFRKALSQSGYEKRRIAILSEAGTVFGSATKKVGDEAKRSVAADTYEEDDILHLTFPRELSLLRNTQANTQTERPAEGAAPPSPYLNLSLKDYNADDTVPSLSGTSPVSVEAQLMSIARQLQRAHSQFILISASNILDDIFLAQFLHRACPDARLVFFSGGDLLFERDGENRAYVGSISISPYLLSFLDFTNLAQWLHSDGQSEAIYNSASYVFRDRTSPANPDFAGYIHYGDGMRIPMWASVIGADGYYPLGILNWCASDTAAISPFIPFAGSSFARCTQPKEKLPLEFLNHDTRLAPSLSWYILDTLILSLCILHVGIFWGAQYWSPFTRDFAIQNNDQPHRRAVYLNIGTAVLVSMAFVIAYPVLRVGSFYVLTRSTYPLVWITLFAATAALVTTFIKTARYFYNSRALDYFFFNCLSIVTLVFTVAVWIYLCHDDAPSREAYSYAGFFFSYRCLNPLSGVSPLVPVLWLLFGWYLWSIFQNARLRFSPIHKPQLPRWERVDAPTSKAHTPYPLFVPENALEACSSPIDNCVYDNANCLLITREVLRRFIVTLWPPPPTADPIAAHKRRNNQLTAVLGVFYLFLFALCILYRSFQSLDRFLFEPILPQLLHHIGPTVYELLVTALFFPLLMVAFSGWLRTIMIWGALSRGLLEPLERMPIRFAFSRMKGGSWMSMLRQSGLHIRWRDMGRTTESIRQLVHHPDLLSKHPALQHRLARQYESINEQVQYLMQHIRKPEAFSQTIRDRLAKAVVGPLGRWDLPKFPGFIDLCLIYGIERRYSTFCRVVLKELLVPYWDQKRTGLVEESNVALPPDSEHAKKSEESEEDDADTKTKSESAPETAAPCDYALIRLAEELIVIRYVALIRAVLVNIRYLMLFVSAAFVVAVLAWNSYPFHPHAFIDWCFTLLLLLIGTGFVWVLAQMHRNAILSRLTDTKPNELGWEFYIRIITFGAVPVLTWLAYQFPSIGGSVFRIFQPGLQVMK